MKRLGLILLFLCSALWAKESALDSAVAPTTIAFTGILTDSTFRADKSLRVELIETGETIPVKFEKPFHLTLPIDTLWNICIYGAAKEKCYEVYYGGSDHSFTFVISVDALMTRYENSEEDRVPVSAFASADSSVAEEDLDVNEFLKDSEANVTELKKVVVQLRRRPKRKIGESVVSAKSMKRMPGLAEADVMRSIQALPGVVASSDFSTKIYVRGGASDQNLFLLDNGVVYSPTHFFGLFSTFLVEGIDEVNFYKGGFSPQYGNRLSSVLDMHSRKGGQDTVDEWLSKSSLKISTFAAQAHTEGHQGDFRWVVAGRSTYISQMLDLFNYIGLLDFTLDYKFTDLQGAVAYDMGDGRELQLSVYTGKDVLAFDPLYVDWGNTVIPLNFRWRLNSEWDYKATLAYSNFFQTMSIADFYSVENEINTFSVKQSLSKKASEDHTVTAGYDFEYNKVLFSEKYVSMSMIDKSSPIHHVAYLMDAWQFNNDLQLVFGTRANYQTLARHFGLEPRFSAHYEIDETKNMEFHVGRYLQYMNSIMFSDQESLNEFYYPVSTQSDGTHLKPSSSYLFSMGYTQREILNDWTGSAEVYYKTQNDLTTFSMKNVDSSETAKSLADYFGTADGYSFGYELSLRKDAGSLFGGVSWSQGWSVVKNTDDGVVYYPNWHQPYSLKVDAGINWKGEKDALWQTKNDRYLRTSVMLKYASGMPVTDRIGYYEISNLLDNGSYQENESGDNIVVVQGQRNAGRQSDYFRLDVKLIDVGRENKWNFSWTIINVTDHENVFSYSYDTTKNPPELVKVTQFPFLPIMLSYEYYF